MDDHAVDTIRVQPLMQRASRSDDGPRPTETNRAELDRFVSARAELVRKPPSKAIAT